MNVTKYICDLLYRHDCVIVPDFGGFLCQRSSARLDESSHTLIPPTKILSFNINLRNNDGLLVHQIAKAEKITYEEALQHIRSTVEEWKKGLADQRYLSMKGIGWFEMSMEYQLIFHPDPQVNFLTETFGLHEVRVRPILRRSQDKNHQWVRYVAALTLPLVVGYGVYFTHLQGSQKNPFDALSSFVPMVSLPVYEKSISQPLPKITLVEPVDPVVESIVEPVSEKEVKPPGRDKFWLIAGVFRSEKRAQNLLKQLRNKNHKRAQVYQEGGKTYVAYDTFLTAKEARNQLSQVKALTEDDLPWIKVIR